MTDDLRFVIVGSGNMSNTYVAAIEKVPGATLVGVVSRSGKRPAKLPADAPVEIATAISAVQSDFDCVVLATPNGLHWVGAEEAAGLGKHVLTEKPLDVTIEHMDRMIAACAANDVRLGVTYQRRMSPDNIVMKGVIERGELGRVYAVDLSVKFYRDQAYYDASDYKGTLDIEGGGAFTQQASHNVDIYCWFFGMPEKALGLLGTLAHEMESEDHGAALLKHSDGMIGTMVASTLAKPGFSARMDIHAAAGTVIMENDIITTWAVDGMANPTQATGAAIHDGATSVAVEDTAGHEALIADFVAAVREGRPPAVTGESARMATELILRIYQSDIG